MHHRQQRLLTILAVLLLALVGVLTWIEPPEEDERALEDPIEVTEDQLERLVLENPEARVAAERTAGGWLMTEPLRTRLDDDAVIALVGLLDRLQVSPELEGLDLATYGLELPQATLTLGRTDGSAHTLAVGTEAPVGFRTYVRVDGGGIRLAEGHPMETLGWPVEALRDRTAHVFAVSAVTGVQWRDGQARWQARRHDGAWFLGDGRRVSSQRIWTLLTALADLRLESFQDDLSAEELAALGLAPPHATVVLEEPGGENTLAIGGERTGGVLVRTPSGVIGTVGEVAGLLADPQTLLEDRVLPYDLMEATALEVSYAGVDVQLTRDGATWLRNGEPHAAAPAHAVDLLTQLQADRSVLHPPGQSTGDHLVATAGAHSVRVVFGSQIDGGRLAWSEGEPAFLVPSDTLIILENVALGVD